MGLLAALYELRSSQQKTYVGPVLVYVYEKRGHWEFGAQIGGLAAIILPKRYSTQDEAADGAMQAVRIAEDVMKGRTSVPLLRAAADKKRGWLKALFEWFADHYDDVAEGD